MSIAVRTVVFALALLTFASPSHSQTAGKVDAGAAELAAEIIGAPVFARQGGQVGEVDGLSFDEAGQPLRLRMKADAHLGLGARVIHVPKDAFVVLRGAVVLDLPAAAVPALSEITDPDAKK